MPLHLFLETRSVSMTRECLQECHHQPLLRLRPWCFRSHLPWYLAVSALSTGRLLRPPRKGSVVVIEFPDGLYEYVTTPVRRVLRLCGREIYYIQTANSRYRLEVRSTETAVLETPAVQ